MNGQPKSVVTIEPARGPLGLSFRELWDSRYLFWCMTLRPIQARYKQTVLGVAWAFIKPLVAAAIFTVFFGNLMGVGKHVAGISSVEGGSLSYALFVFSGLLAWNFAASVVSGAAGITVGNSSMITRVYFPRILLPLSVLGAALLDFAIASVVLVALLVRDGILPGLSILALPLVLTGVAACAVGVGCFLSALNVRYRDFTHLLPFLVQTWFFLTPVIYPSRIVPEKYGWLAALNPMTGLVNAFRSCVLGLPVEAGNLCISCAVALLCLLGGVFYFRQVEDYFADII